MTKNSEPHGLYVGVPAIRLKDLSQNEELPVEYFTVLTQ